MTSEAEKSNNIPDDTVPHIPDVKQEMIPQKQPPIFNDDKPQTVTTETPPIQDTHKEDKTTDIHADSWDNQEDDNIEPPKKSRFPIEKFGVSHPKYKQVTPETLEFYWNYIGKTAIPKVQLGHAQFVSYFHYGTLFRQFYPMPHCFNVAVLVNEHEYIHLSLPKDLTNFILHPLIEPLSVNELGEDIIMNLLEVSFAPYLENIEKAFGFKISLNISQQAMQNAEVVTQWVVQEANSGQSCAINIFGKKDNIKDFFDKIYHKANMNAKIKPTISLSIISAIKQFSVQKVSALKHGEIIIILANRHLVNEPLAIIGQRLVINTQISDGKLNIQSDPMLISEIAELNMNQGDAAVPEQSAGQQSIADNVAASMTDMRVPVTFELARMDLPVTSLSSLGKGQILDLNKAIDENVSIVVNGKVVALGEVVQVGRNFGVIVKEVV